MRKVILALVVLCAAAGAFGARTLALAQVNRTGRTVESFDFTFGGDAGGTTYALCMAYGTGDGGFKVEGWEHVVKLADVGPDVTELAAVPVPAGVTGDAQWAKFFLCDEFEELDYIRSVGSSQIIDTGFTPDATTMVAIDCQLMALTGNTSACCLFGGRKQGGDTNKKFVYWFTLDNGNIYPAINWGNADSGYIKTPAAMMNDTFHVISNDCANLYVDDTRIYSNPTATWHAFTDSYTMVMFGMREIGSYHSRSIEARVRSVLIKNGGSVQRDYVAAVRTGGKAGLFDRANNKMYFAGADFSTTDRGVPTGRYHYLGVAEAPAVPVHFGSRTVEVAQVNKVGGMDVSVDLAFGGDARGTTYALYMGYGAADAGANPQDWEHLTRLTDVGPTVTSLDAVPVPRADCVRFFLCSEYEQLEYITSDSGQIIDTGVVPTATMTVALDWQIVSADRLDANGISPVFGVRGGTDTYSWRWVWWLKKIVDQNQNVYVYPAINWGSVDSGYQQKNGAQVNLRRNVLRTELGPGLTFYVDGKEIWGNAEATFATADPRWTLILFGMRNGTGATLDFRSGLFGIRIYGMKFDDGGAPMLDCVPALRNGRAGLFDRVHGDFYTARDGADFVGPARGPVLGTLIHAAAASPVQNLVTASAATGAARPLAVVPKTYAANGALASVTVTFPEGEGLGTLALYAVYGATAGGDTVASWEHGEKVGDIPGTTTSVDYALPAGWGTTYRYLRFIYKPEESTLPAFFDSSVTPVAYLASDGSNQSIQVPKHVLFGETFTLKWRQFVLDVNHTNEDKGFDFGSGALDVCGGGRHSFNDTFLDQVSPYVFWGHRGFSPTFYLREMNTNDVYVDTIRMTRPFVYEKKRLVDGKTWNIRPGLNTPEGYESDTDFFLFRGYNGHNGRKAIYSARVFTTEGHLSINLVPVVKNGVAGYYDSVGGTFYENSGSGTFVVGEPVDLTRGASALVCAAEQEVPVFGDVSHAGESSGDSFTVSGTLARTGGGTAAVTVQFATSDDYATVTDWPAGDVAVDGGAFTATVTSVMPGTTVYWRAKAVNAASGATVYTAWSPLAMPGATVLGALDNLASTGLVVTPGAFTVTPGYGTTYLWLEWGTTPECRDGTTAVRAYPYGTAINFTEKPQMPGYGDYYYRLVASNACATAVTVSQSEPVLHRVIDNITYTWCGGAAGSWCAAANWTKSGTSGLGYPNSDACAVAIPAADSPVITFDGNVSVLTLSAADGGTCVIQGVPNGGNALVISNAFFTGTNAKMTFKDCAVSAMSFSAKKAGSELTFTNAVVTTLPTENNCLAAGSGGRIVIADSQVTTQNVYFDSDGNGSEYVIQGRTATLRVARNFRCAWGFTGGILRIVIPDGGFDATPIAQAGSEFSIPFAWYTDWPANAAYTFSLQIDPASPGLFSERNFTQTLIDWSVGIKKSNLPFGAFAKPSTNRLVYGDDTDLPAILTFVHERTGLMVIFR